MGLLTPKASGNYVPGYSVQQLKWTKGPICQETPCEITPCHMFHSPLLSPGPDPVTGGRLPYRYGKQQFEQNVSNNGRQGRRTTVIIVCINCLRPIRIWLS